jgi:hypothetical protein
MKKNMIEENIKKTILEELENKDYISKSSLPGLIYEKNKYLGVTQQIGNALRTLKENGLIQDYGVQAECIEKGDKFFE